MNLYGRCVNALPILSRRGVIEPISLHSDAELKYLAPIAIATQDTVL